MKSKTVILGAGFAGRQACRALSRTDTEIILFDPRAETVMLPALPDVAGGWIPEKILFRSIDEVVPDHVHHIREKATAIDLDQKKVTAGNTEHPFDHLLIAGGSVADFHGFDQHLESVYTLDTLESARRIREDFPRYLANASQPHLVIAGGGYTGLELAAALRFRSIRNGTPCRVTVADPAEKILPFLSEKEHRRILTFLEAAGIQILHNTRITAFNGDAVHIGETVLENAFFCWAGGSKLAVPDVRGKVQQLKDGRLRVQPDLSLPGYPDVFAAGDSAALMDGEQPLRKAINFAYYEGLRAGKNISSRIRNKPTKPFKPVDLGWIIPLHAQSTGKLFSALPVHGRPGLRMHYFMCGLRNYSLRNFMQFTKISLALFGKEKTS